MKIKFLVMEITSTERGSSEIDRYDTYQEAESRIISEISNPDVTTVAEYFIRKIYVNK